MATLNGLSWEEGQRLPIGLSIKRTGFERVTVTCALCHTTSYRLQAEDTPRFAVGGPAHTANIQGLIRFLIAASKDERFTAERLMPEVALQFKLEGIDWLLYSAVLIPKTRLALHLLEDQVGWMNDRPAWGPGRDDAFNLPKFILTQSPWDHSVGNTDFPAVWGMGARRGQLLHWGGEAKTLYAVTATSALGTGALPGKDFEAMAQWTDEFISALAPPPYPAPIDKELAARGQTIYAAQCASCHDGKGSRVGTSIAGWPRSGTGSRACPYFLPGGRRSHERPDAPARTPPMPSCRAPRAMSRGRLSGSGCWHPISTMARSRPCVPFWPHLISGRRSSIAASTSSISRMSASAPPDRLPRSKAFASTLHSKETATAGMSMEPICPSRTRQR